MKRTTVSALLVGGLLFTAACGDDAGDGNGNGAAPNAGASQPAGDPIVIGVVGGYTGNQAGSQGLSDDASLVWEQAVNASGGINGHPVELIVEDDANDPAKALQAVKKLIEEDNVLAIVGMQSLVSAQWADYARDQGVAVIGGTPIESPFLSHANFFPTGASAPVMIVGQLIRMKEAGLKKMGIFYCAESPICAQLEGLTKASAALVGDVEVVAAAKVSATQPSYTAECLALKEAGVDALFAGVQAPAVVTITAGCDKVGFRPRQVSQLTVVNSQWFSAPQLDGALFASPNVAYNDESVPAVKEFTDAIQEYQPEILDSPQYTVNLIWSWMAGKMFEKVAEAADLSPTSTREDVFKGLYTIKDETLDGLSVPLTYVEGQPTFVSCWFNVNLEDGALKSPNGHEPVCLDAAQAEGLGKILSGG